MVELFVKALFVRITPETAAKFKKDIDSPKMTDRD